MAKGPYKTPLPWDIVVFVTITTVGFGFSVQHLMNGRNSPLSRPPIFASAKAEQRGPDSFSAGTTLNLGCLEQKLSSQRVETMESVIRIRGKFCLAGVGKAGSEAEVNVVNSSTGYQGTVFFQKDVFVTDFLVIEPGVNLIRVEWKTSSASPSQTFTAEVIGR